MYRGQIGSGGCRGSKRAVGKGNTEKVSFSFWSKMMFSSPFI